VEKTLSENDQFGAKHLTLSKIQYLLLGANKRNSARSLSEIGGGKTPHFWEPTFFIFFCFQFRHYNNAYYVTLHTSG
jgi:hypothetical protein